MLNCINGLSIRKVEKQCAGDSENKRSYETVDPRGPNATRDQYAIISSLPSLCGGAWKESRGDPGACGALECSRLCWNHRRCSMVICGQAAAQVEGADSKHIVTK